MLAIKGENNQFKIQIENLIDEIKNLSENILRSVKSKGFKYIDLPQLSRLIILFKDQVKALENSYFHSLIMTVKSYALDLI